MRTLGGLALTDVDLRRGLARCPGCGRWATDLCAAGGRFRCEPCLAATDPVIRAALRLFGGPLERVGP